MKSPLPSGHLALETGLSRATLTLTEAARHVGADRRLDLTGVPGGALGLVLAEAMRNYARPTLVVSADVEAMRRVAADLEFFLASQSGEPVDVLRYPGSELSPFVEAAPDRRSELERMATLASLCRGENVPIVVTTVNALVRRVPPREAIMRESRLVRPLDELDRDDLIATLDTAGYLRVPIVEDPGTFAVRGGLVDIFPVEGETPVRVELDDDLVASLRTFEPEDQRTREAVDALRIAPVRPVRFAGEQGREARGRVTDLCDSLNMPTSKRITLIEELESGRHRLGVEALLPAAYPALETLFDYLPEATAVVVCEPTAVSREAHATLDRAHADFAARGGQPAYPVSVLFLDVFELADALNREALTVVHTLAVGGTPDESESPLAHLESTGSEPAQSLGGDDHAGLVSLLKQRRKTGGHGDALEPLADQVRALLSGGLRVLLSAHSRTQGERMAGLLRGYDVPVLSKVEPFVRERLERPPPGKAEVVLGPLSEGFVLAPAGLCCVTETEMFGARPSRPKRASKALEGSSQNFLEDLRELHVGDYVVHVEHGVGRYKGLEKKLVPISRYEALQGMKPVGVEVLAIEYLGGTLFLPVTRLNQIQKHSSGDGKGPRLDKLGGQTFEKTKARVRGEVRVLADDLLKIYAERAANTRPALEPPGRAFAEFEANFPYEETPDQARAINDVLADLERPQAMDRVVCGDVGFGKTEVALRAAFRAALAGRQVALLCPTSVLAQQHLLTFRDRMADYALEVEGLSRFVPRKEQTAILSRLKQGKVDVVIGTHRVLGKDVHFRNLGMLIVDEEQRFGVSHKERIKAMRAHVDVLTLSATPIPRTLQMAVTGIRDLSLIATPPVDRRAIRTFVTRWDERVIREALEREISRGGQAFFVHNRIDSLHERAARLKELVPEARIGVAHGQMTEVLLEQVMRDFIEGRTDVLCSTAIVESGLDIPRANTILIDRADHYGLAQLYQLRGRVGRAKERAYCYLIAPPPSVMTDEARARVHALERFTELGSGFKVASLDLELRGAGDLLGAEQSGSVSAVGFDLFVQMLEAAVAELRGHPVAAALDTDLNLDMPLSIPDDYVDDVGTRLSLYKRLGNAQSAEAVHGIGQEMEDRFGPPPTDALRFVRAMALKPGLRALRALGCEGTRGRVTLHLADDTPLSPTKLLPWVTQQKRRASLSPDGRLTLRFDPEAQGDSIDRVEQALRELSVHLEERAHA